MYLGDGGETCAATREEGLPDPQPIGDASQVMGPSRGGSNLLGRQRRGRE